MAAFRSPAQVRADALALDEEMRRGLLFMSRVRDLAGPNADAQTMAKAFEKASVTYPSLSEAYSSTSARMNRPVAELDGSGVTFRKACGVLLGELAIDAEDNGPGPARLLRKCGLLSPSMQKLLEENPPADEEELTIRKADASGPTHWKILRVHMSTPSGSNLLTEPWGKYNALLAWKQGAPLAGTSVEALGNFKITPAQVDWTTFSQCCASRGVIVPESLMERR